MPARRLESWGPAAWSPECTCLLLSEKMSLLLVHNSELTWASLSWLERELCFIWPTVCWTAFQSIVGFDSIVGSE